MNDYRDFAFVYDDVMGDRKDVARYVASLIKKYQPKAKTLLELGCGTGSMLVHLARSYSVTGIDLSAEMLRSAHIKLPQLKFHCADITDFKLDKRFDCIICVFDTINHVTSLKKWESIFRNVVDHLSDSGIFIFDINTVKKIKRYSEELPYALEGRESVCIVNVTPMRGCNYSLDITAFSKAKDNYYRSFRTKIPEVTFEKRIILTLLKKYFKKVVTKDPERIKDSAQTEELYFICSRPIPKKSKKSIKR